MDHTTAKDTTTYSLKQFHELRILPPTPQAGNKNSASQSTVTVHLKTGSCECFGANMVPGIPYNLSARGGYSFFSWSGCELEVIGSPTLIYTTNDTIYPLLANINYELEKDRKQSDNNNVSGPITLILGRQDTGKSSIVRTLAHYALRTGWHPLVIDLNTEVNAFSISGTLTAAPIEFQPKSTHLERFAKTTPAVFFYGHDSLEANKDLYLQQCSALSKLVTQRLLGDKSRPVDFPGFYTVRDLYLASTQIAHDQLHNVPIPGPAEVLVDIPPEIQGKTKHAGIFIDSPPQLTTAENRLELITKLVEIFHINVILCVDNDHLHQELLQHQPLSIPTLRPAIAKIPRSLGVIYRSPDERAWAAKQTITRYFHGGKDQLKTRQFRINPLSVIYYSTFPIDFVPTTALPLDTAAQYQQTQGQYLERMECDQLKLNSILALSYTNDEASISTTPVLGFFHVEAIPNPLDPQMTLLAPASDIPYCFNSFLAGSITYFNPKQHKSNRPQRQ